VSARWRGLGSAAAARPAARCTRAAPRRACVCAAAACGPCRVGAKSRRADTSERGGDSRAGADLVQAELAEALHHALSLERVHPSRAAGGGRRASDAERHVQEGWPTGEVVRLRLHVAPATQISARRAQEPHARRPRTSRQRYPFAEHHTRTRAARRRGAKVVRGRATQYSRLPPRSASSPTRPAARPRARAPPSRAAPAREPRPPWRSARP
jgi:hypothetical protein